MKVLVSAYACSPYDGSERAVGWNWVNELSKYHELTVLTSHIYQNDIEDYLCKNPDFCTNVKFVYINVPHTGWHVGYRLERLYYILWQVYAVKVAKELCKKTKYDLVHHITYVTCVLPTFMHKLNIPFVYGPVSGGENIPKIIKYPMSFKQHLVENVRRVSQIFFRLTPNYSKTMRKADVILTTTEETKLLIPTKYRSKVKVFQSIGLNEDIFSPLFGEKYHHRIKFLIAGRMLYWKGFELGIKAFSKALESGCDIELTVLGNAENNSAYKAYFQHLIELSQGIKESRIHFVPTVPHDQMKNFYDQFDCLLNCSLRDSGCFIVMEGMSRGLPVICVNTGGPKVNTTDETAIKINPAPMDIMIDKIAGAIVKIANNKELREKMGKASREYALDNFIISRRTQIMNEYYAEALERSNGR